MIKSPNPKELIKKFGFLLLVAALTACSHAPTQPEHLVLDQVPTEFARLDLPNYRLGDRYLYSRGAPETVTEIDGEKLVWRIGKSRTTQAWRNFLLPRIAWQRREIRYAESVKVKPDFLWPLLEGKSGGYWAARTHTNLSGKELKFYEKRWGCEIEARARVRVLAGEFDTQVVQCRRTSALNDYRQTSIWYYSPELEHIVLKVDKYPGKPDRVKQLIAVEPGFIGELGLYAEAIKLHTQATLENSPLNVKSTWRQGRHWVEVVAVATQKSASGVFCRNYRTRVNTSGYQKLYAGIACRNAKGQWRPPQN